MLARSAKAGLDLVGDAHAAGGARMFVSVLQVTIREHHRAAHALNGLGDESGNLARGGIVNHALDVRGVLPAGIGIVSPPLAPIGIGHDGVVDAETVGDIELPGAMSGKAHSGHVAAMIAVAQGNDVVVAGVSAGHEHGEIIGLGAGVDEVADFEVAGQFRGQGAPVFGDIGVEVDGGGMLKRFTLFAHRLQHIRVAVADRDGGNAGEGIKVTPAPVVPNVLALAFHDHERRLVHMEQRGAEELLAQAINLVGRRSGVGLGLV